MNQVLGIRSGRRFALLLVVAVVVTSCVQVPELPEGMPVTAATPSLVVAFGELPGWFDDDHAAALPALASSCQKLGTLPADRNLGVGGLGGQVDGMHRICEALESVPPGSASDARAFFERWFVPLALPTGRPVEGKFTGYFEPEVAGRRTPVPGAEPLYRRPPELVEIELGRFRPEFDGVRLAGRVVNGEFVPMPDRAAIQEGALAGRNLELVWVLDPVEAFFLHVQGSGRVRLPDGAIMRVGYAGANGHPYYAIGRTLLHRGAIEPEDMSLQSIATWLRANPADMRALMAENASYVFFEQRLGTGPVGAAGVVLTPGRSVAVDPAYIPWHLPVWVVTRVPTASGLDEPFQHLLLAQDTGSAIKGSGRGDLFFGHGPLAREQAGRMHASGQVWALVPRASLAAAGRRH